MGRGTRPVPKLLPRKLKGIRLNFQLSQERMVERLISELNNIGYYDIKIYVGHIGEYERGQREPFLPILLAYSVLSEISLNDLIDDRVEITN